MAEFVPKLRVAATLAQAGEPHASGYFSLAPHSAHHIGPETLLERLNAPDRLVPFLRAGDGATLLIARQSIEWVMAGPGVDLERVCPPPLFTTAEERVRVRFESGATVDGMLRMELPEHLNRASDFLNGAEDFFPLVTGETLRLVNKMRVMDVTVFQTSPAPPRLQAAPHSAQR